MSQNLNNSEFKEIFLNTELRDKFYLFLQNIYNIYPEDSFHLMIYQQVQKYNTDQEIYAAIIDKLPTIKVPLNDLKYSLPALFKQKKEMAQETL